MIVCMGNDHRTPKSNPAVIALINREKEQNYSKAAVSQIAAIDIMTTDGIIIPAIRKDGIEEKIVRKLELYLQRYADHCNDILADDLEQSAIELSKAVEELHKLRQAILDYVSDGDLNKLMEVALS